MNEEIAIYSVRSKDSVPLKMKGEEGLWGKMTVSCYYCCFLFVGLVWFSETGFLCIAPAVPELTLYTKLASNSEIHQRLGLKACTTTTWFLLLALSFLKDGLSTHPRMAWSSQFLYLSLQSSGITQMCHPSGIMLFFIWEMTTMKISQTLCK